MRKNNFKCALLVAALCSCAGPQDGYETEYSVEIEPEDAVLHFSDIYDDYECVYLTGETVSNIRDIIVREDGFIVMGRSDAAAISFFTRDGRYVRSITRIGRGPGEFTDIQAMAYNPYTETLDVLGNIGTTVVKYDYKSFEEVGSFSIMETDIMSAQDFCPIDADRYMFYKDYSVLESEEYFLYVFNRSSSQVEDEMLPMDKRLVEMLSFGQQNNLYSRDGAVYFYAAFQKYIYRYENGRLSGYLEFAPNRYMNLDKLLKRKYNDVAKFVTEVCQPSPYIWAHINVFAYHNLIFSSYTYRNDVYDNVMDIAGGASHSYRSISDDMVWGVETDDLRSVYSLTATDSEYVVYVVEPFLLNELIDGQMCSGPDDMLQNRKIISGLADDANPVILLMRQEK